MPETIALGSSALDIALGRTRLKPSDLTAEEWFALISDSVGRASPHLMNHRGLVPIEDWLGRSGSSPQGRDIKGATLDFPPEVLRGTRVLASLEVGHRIIACGRLTREAAAIMAEQHILLVPHTGSDRKPENTLLRASIRYQRLMCEEVRDPIELAVFDWVGGIIFSALASELPNIGVDLLCYLHLLLHQEREEARLRYEGIQDAYRCIEAYKRVFQGF